MILVSLRTAAPTHQPHHLAEHLGDLFRRALGRRLRERRAAIASGSLPREGRSIVIGEQVVDVVVTSNRRIVSGHHHLMDRLIEADNPVLIAAYEEQVRKLHSDRITAQEKLAGPAPAAGDFEESYRTALEFIEKPANL